MKNWISVSDVEEFILSKKPFFYKYSVGSKVTYKYYGGIETGTIVKRGIKINGRIIEAEYEIKYGEEEYQTRNVEERNISIDKAVLKKFERFEQELDQNKAERERLLRNFKNAFDLW